MRRWAWQVRDYWLPRLLEVSFVCLADDVMPTHLASCMSRAWVAMSLNGSTLTVTVGEGTTCRSSGTSYDYVRVSGAWQRDVSGRVPGGFATGHCRCPNGTWIVDCRP